VVISLGMSKGLPLANPKQMGSPFSAIIQQAYGNWQGVNQTLDLKFYVDSGTFTMPRDIVFNWLKNTPMADAIQTTLQTAFPGFPIKIAISPNLVRPDTQPGKYNTLQQFGETIRKISKSVINKPDYPGVQMRIQDNTIYVFDYDYNGSGSVTRTTQANPKQIDFTDIVGQPTWTGIAQMQFNCVMRFDIIVGDFIRLPATQQTTTQNSFTALRDKLTFSGVYQVVQIRNVGNFRSPNAESWITVIDTIAKAAT
jgi:hypothetical protein